MYYQVKAQAFFSGVTTANIILDQQAESCFLSGSQHKPTAVSPLAPPISKGTIQRDIFQLL
jgi:hypothetical protein